MTSKTTATVTLPQDRQILIVREFDAPRHLVWRAYTEPELVQRWWGAKRGEGVTAEIDLRVGGTWRYVMVAEGGFEVGFHGEFREIVEGERLVMTEVFEGAGPDAEANGGLNTITFVAQGDRTVLEMLCEYPSKEVRDLVIDSGMEGGMQESMDALEQVAASLR